MDMASHKLQMLPPGSKVYINVTEGSVVLRKHYYVAIQTGSAYFYVHSVHFD
jgi:hypothetical protein